MQLRPEDFQHSWANALAHAMSLAQDLMAEARAAQQSADSSREELVALAERIPGWIDEAGKRLERMAALQIARIEATHKELLDAQDASLSQFKAEKEALAQQRAELKDQIFEALREQAKAQKMMEQVQKERDAFNNRGLWDRIFAKA